MVAPCDIRPQLTEAFVQVFIPAFNMMDLGDHTLSFGSHGRRTQRRSAPEIGTAHRCPMQPGHSGDDCHLALGADTGAHPGHLVHMAVTVLENRFGKNGGAVCLQGRCHQRGLGIGGKTGIRHSAHPAQ